MEDKGSTVDNDNTWPHTYARFLMNHAYSLSHGVAAPWPLSGSTGFQLFSEEKQDLRNVMKQLLFLKLTLHMCQFITFVYIMLLDYSLHCAKSSLSLVFIRTFSVSCAPLSMLGNPGGTGCGGVRFPGHGWPCLISNPYELESDQSVLPGPPSMALKNFNWKLK